MTDKPCSQCRNFVSTTGPSGWLELCGDNGISTAFARADIGLYGAPHCGPEGKFHQHRER
jgi:hypothetical protein